jgi:hypothetical protein
MGLPRHFDFPAGRVGGFGVHGSTGGATGAGFGLLYFDWRSHTRRTLSRFVAVDNKQEPPADIVHT